jgi:DNA topoisomerase IB
MAIKVQILVPCSACNGEAYEPVGEASSYTGEQYTRYQPCTQCQGSGNQVKWVSLLEFGEMLSDVMSRDPMDADYPDLARKLPVTQYADSREAAGI